MTFRFEYAARRAILMSMRHVLTALLAIAAAPAFADDQQLCGSANTPFAARVAACERVAETAVDRVEAIIDIGRVYEGNEDYAEALQRYSQALAIDPVSVAGLGRRSVVLGRLDRWDEAEADLRALIAVNPDSHWPHYRLGYVLSQSDRTDLALAALDRAIALNADYHSSHLLQGIIHARLHDYEAAAWSYREVTRIRPLDRDRQLRAHSYFRRAGLADEAAYHGRIAYTLDPNDIVTGEWLTGYLGDTSAPDLPPLAWTPPPAGREIRYLAIEMPVDTRDEMEAAIGALAGLFSGNAEPIPETAAVIGVSHDPVDEDWLTPAMQIEHQRSLDPPIGEPSPRYRGLFPFQFSPMGPDGPAIVPSFDDGTPSDAWPLQAGRSAAGSGRFVVDCSAGRGFSYSILGCLPEVDLAEAGQFQWTLAVSTERIHVPLGMFDTYRLDFTMDARVSVLGQERDLSYTASFWIAPEVNTWIARILTAEDRYIYSQAMDLVGSASVSAEGSE
jgi:tetratricopeptide (TPR) repeat protein